MQRTSGDIDYNSGLYFISTMYKGKRRKPVEFFEAGDKFKSQAEYWRVSMGHEHYLLPRPIDPFTYRDLSSVFAGNAPPHKLKGSIPARIAASQRPSVDYILEITGTLL